MNPIGRRLRFWFVSLCLALIGSGPLVHGAEPVVWSEIRAEQVRDINRDIQSGALTADIGIYFPSNLDPAFTRKFSLDDLLLQFKMAKSIFRAAQVELKLLWVKTGRIDPSHLEIQANDLVGKTPGGQYVNLYENNLRETSVLSQEARKAFEAIVEPHKNNSRTVYLIVLQDVFMSFFERVDERTWQPRTITTGGLSFPTYSYRDLPPRLRGVITINKADLLRSIVAHELGHKLMNVSHEYRQMSPQHEILGDGGLMLYGKGTEIPAGADGRWHRERLHLSPFFYREAPNRKRQWNADYREGGHYYDPIYGDKIVRFDPTELPSPAK
jgi:hypothetical protein